ncbi:MAG: S-methyl-5'-thioadenosine phosphorylase [Nitrospinota bacterium]
MTEGKIGIIGGSGLYEMEELSEIREERVDTPFGEPSDAYILGKMLGKELVFLPRHGRGHRILPSELNFRANIYGMKKLGVDTLLSVSAVGSMKEAIEPGHIVIPDQFFDMTKNRISTFLGNGVVGHAGFGDPICPSLKEALYHASVDSGATTHKNGTYVCIEGPLFSSRAESLVYRSWGVDVIGMTNATEAKLAREAEICYSTIALSTDYDCWHEEEEDVTADAVLAIIHKNVAMAKKILKKSIETIGAARECTCRNAMEHAIVTSPELIPEKTKKDLDLIIGRYIKE